MVAMGLGLGLGLGYTAICYDRYVDIYITNNVHVCHTMPGIHIAYPQPWKDHGHGSGLTILQVTMITNNVQVQYIHWAYPGLSD